VVPSRGNASVTGGLIEVGAAGVAGKSQAHLFAALLAVRQA
jgi:hypothetical protein